MVAAATTVSVGGKANVAVADFEIEIGCGSMIVDFAAVIVVVGVGTGENDGDWDDEDCGTGDGLITWAGWGADERRKVVEVQVQDFHTAGKSLRGGPEVKMQSAGDLGTRSSRAPNAHPNIRWLAELVISGSERQAKGSKTHF